MDGLFCLHNSQNSKCLMTLCNIQCSGSEQRYNNNIISLNSDSGPFFILREDRNLFTVTSFLAFFEVSFFIEEFLGTFLIIISVDKCCFLFPLSEFKGILILSMISYFKNLPTYMQLHENFNGKKEIF